MATIFKRSRDAGKKNAHWWIQYFDHEGNRHDWRAELVAELVKRQQSDGSWVNKNDRWLEGDSNLATGFALLALSYCRP